jgi:hypothetical protein
MRFLNSKSCSTHLQTIESEPNIDPTSDKSQTSAAPHRHGSAIAALKTFAAGSHR